jgi:uncharacterized protein with WD repeat
LKKKLKQIEDIRARIDSGEQVELTQIQKLDSEATILKEVLTYFNYKLNDLTLGA